MSFTLNYDEWIHLDAENLAETGIGLAYESLLPTLRKFVAQPVQIDEMINNDLPRYSVKCGATEYVIHAPGLREESGSNCWGRATHAFFDLVNNQLAGSNVRFYAINGGNDLGGMFLTAAEAQAARATLPRKLDWPYLPTDEEPWYGQHH